MQPETREKGPTDDAHQQGQDAHPSHPPQYPTPDPPNPPTAAPSEMLAAEKGQQGLTDWQIVKQLTSYVWPRDNPDYRWRVAGASVLLVGSKALNVTVSHTAATYAMLCV